MTRTVQLDLDTPAGEQASWLLEHVASGDLTVEDVAAHIDPQALRLGPFALTPAGFVALQRWLETCLGSPRVKRVLSTRSSAPFQLEVTSELDDGSRWTHKVRVAEEAPHRIVELQPLVADDEPPGEAGPGLPIVRCVDHFFVGLADPKRALDLLTTGLGLQVVLPWTQYTDGSGHGVVELGNAQLELMNFAVFRPQTPARLQGIAFEPPPLTDALISEIDRRGIPHAPPMHIGYFTNIFFSGLISDPDTVAFCCRYHHPAIRDRAARQAALEASRGGELGITRVVELAIGTSRWHKLVDRWQNLLDPITPVEPGCWRIGDGPAIRIVEGAEDAVREIVLGVRSVEAAAARVKELGVGSVEPAEKGALLDLPALNGLVIRLVDNEGGS